MNTDGSCDQRDPGDGHEISMQKILMDQTLVASNMPGVRRGIPASHPDAPETFLAESDPSTMAPRDDGEAETSLGDDDDDRDDADDITEPVVEAGAGASMNGDPRHVLGGFPEKWHVPSSRHYEYAVRTPDGDRDYRKMAEAVVRLVEKYYGEE